MLCCRSTCNSLILVMNNSLLGHWTAAPRSSNTKSFMFSSPSLDSGAFPKHIHSGTTNKVMPSSSSYNPFTFLTMASKFFTLPNIRAWSSSPTSFVMWHDGSGSIWRYTWCSISPLNKEEYSTTISGFGRHDFSWNRRKKNYVLFAFIYTSLSYLYWYYKFKINYICQLCFYNWTTALISIKFVMEIFDEGLLLLYCPCILASPNFAQKVAQWLFWETKRWHTINPLFN